MDCVLICGLKAWYCLSPLKAVLQEDGWAFAAHLEALSLIPVLEVHPDQSAERDAADNNGEQLALAGTGLLRRCGLRNLMTLSLMMRVSS